MPFWPVDAVVKVTQSRFVTVSASTCSCMDSSWVWMSSTASGTLMRGSSERMRVPLEIFCVATRPLPFPGTSCRAYIRLAVEFDIFVYYPLNALFEWRVCYRVLSRLKTILEDKSWRNSQTLCGFHWWARNVYRMCVTYLTKRIGWVSCVDT